MKALKEKYAVSLATGILGLFYFVYAGMMLYNWITETFMQGTGSIGNILGLFIPADPGCAIALITVGMLMLGSLYYKLDDARGVSCVFLGSLLGVALLTIQLLIMVANVANIGVSLLSREATEYVLFEDILRPEIVLGIGSMLLFFFSILKVRQITGK